jgi:protein-tyrosine phosphatase
MYMWVVMADQAASADMTRHITWEGFINARDLGGLPTQDGRVTRFGAYIRSADFRFATEAGWRMARDTGVRTVIDLRNDVEIRQDTAQRSSRSAGPAPFAVAATAVPPPCDIRRSEVALDDIEDTAFRRFLKSERLDTPPLSFRPFLDRQPERCAAVITALASAPPGGVLFHCRFGRDRTGLVTLLVLAVAGVEPEAIADDYEMSTEPLRQLFARTGKPDQGAIIEAALAERDTTVRDAILATLDGFDAGTYLLAAGASHASLAAIRRRLLG